MTTPTEPPTSWESPAGAPPRPEDAAPPGAPPKAPKSGVPVPLAAGVAVVLVAGLAALAVAYFSLRSENLDLRAEIRELEEVEADREAEEDARPDLRAIARGVDARRQGTTYRGDEDSLTVEVLGGLDWIEEFLDTTGFPAATVDRMGQTRALDGTLEAQGDGVTATWTYHPDDGLNIVFSVDG